MATYSEALIEGLAVQLDAWGIGVWRGPDGVYTAGERAIRLGRILQEPDEGIGITPYADTPGVLDVTATMVQLRVRGTADLRVGLRVTDALRNRLHKRTHYDLGPVRVTSSTLESFAQLGPDSNGRYEYTQNFRFVGSRTILPA